MKTIDWHQAAEIVVKLHIQKKTVVFTNGCFDILHAGHVRYLRAARELGDCLIIGLNSDTSVRLLKGPQRPINPQEDRAEVLSGLSSVDYIVLFDDKTAENLIGFIHPDIYAKGGDYSLEQLPESKIVATYGGRTVIIPKVPGRSTTNAIQKIHKS